MRTAQSVTPSSGVVRATRSNAAPMKGALRARCSALPWGMTTVDSRIQTFRRLHESGCFVIPNPWDVGSALVLEQLGFSALATTIVHARK